MPHNEPVPQRKWVVGIVILAVLVAFILCRKG